MSRLQADLCPCPGEAVGLTCPLGTCSLQGGVTFSTRVSYIPLAVPEAGRVIWKSAHALPGHLHRHKAPGALYSAQHRVYPGAEEGDFIHLNPAPTASPQSVSALRLSAFSFLVSGDIYVDFKSGF